MHPIVKQAFHTHFQIYKWWFPCKITWNNNEFPIRLRLESPWWKLLPWYFVTWIMTFGSTFGSIGYLLIRELFKPSSRINAIQTGVLFWVAVCTLYSWGICLAFHKYWREIVSAFNQLTTFEEDWVRTDPNTYRRPIKHYLRIWKCNKEELTGMFLIMMIVSGSIITMPMGLIAGVITNLDPFLILLEDYFLPPTDEQSTLLKVSVFLLRFCLVFIGGMEVCRFFFLALLLTFSMGLVMEKLLINMLKTQDFNEAHHKYKLMWLQYYIVKSAFNNLLAIGAFTIFAGGTTMIWLSFNAWNYVTPYLAVVYPFLSVSMLILLLIGIKSQVSIVEMSKCFIHQWKRESLLQPGIRMRKNIRHYKMLGRTLRSLPVACGSCYGINSDTPFSFLQILMKSVTDSLLGIQL
ncbi:unnamed protein product [Orchesella dallaii]|uniref:Odorant receptor n=1 Tax=Orchesella dallaii TaxID=48710 RepID=A0ABP1R7B1_9HEXA